MVKGGRGGQIKQRSGRGEGKRASESVRQELLKAVKVKGQMKCEKCKIYLDEFKEEVAVEGDLAVLSSCPPFFL